MTIRPFFLHLLATLLVSASVWAQEGEPALSPLDAEAAAAFERLDSGDIDAAEASFVALTEREPGYARGHAGLATVFAARADWAAALATAERATQLESMNVLANVILCRAHVAMGDLSAAERSCTVAAELAPDEPTIYQSACAAALGQYEWTRAVAWCGAGAEIDPSSPELLWRLGVALANIGQSDAAEIACARAVELAPGDGMPHYCEGVVEMEARNYSAAWNACDRGLGVAPGNGLLWYCRGMASLQQDQVEAALADCQQAVTTAPREALGHFCIGRIARARGDWDGARAALQRAIDLNAALDEARATMGDVYTRAGDLAAGEQWLREAIDRAPTGDRYAQLGMNLFAQRRFEDALAAYVEADRRNPGQPAYLANLGVCSRSLGRVDEALDYLSRAISAEPSNPGWSATYAEIAIGEGRPADATDALRAALGRHPGEARLLELLCEAQVRSEAWVEAELTCNRAIATTPENPVPYGLLGVLYIETGRPDEAETALRGATGRGARDAATWINLGTVLMVQDQVEDALSAYATAVAADPTAAWARYAYGLALRDAGRRDESQRQLCEAADLEPSNAAYASACGR